MTGKTLLRTAAAWLLALHVIVSPALAAAADSVAFRSPMAAVDALLEALRADDTARLDALFGPDAEDLISSGDEVADRETRRQFVAGADLRTRLDRESEGRVILSIGADDWPFPIPLVRGEAGWHFDAAAGAEELVNRRIGRNELHAIAVMNAFVGAQYEYFARAPMGEGQRRYAQRIRSSEGKRDGLSWPVAEGEAESPLGPLVAQATEEGYFKGDGQDREGPDPYHGYIFRMLTAQGPHAPGGASSYVEGGAMTLGFALLAYPVAHGSSGIMTFIVNQRGIVYQKDLGPDTARIAESIEAFDPDPGWEPVAL